MYEEYQRFFNDYLKMLKEDESVDFQYKKHLARNLEARLCGMLDLIGALDEISIEKQFEERDKIKEAFKL